MITKEDILKMVAKVSRRSRNLGDRRLIHPEREWSLALIVLVLLLGMAFFINAKRFSYFSNIEDNLRDETTSAVEYKYGTMREVLDRYEDRMRRFQELRQGAGVNEVLVETPAPSETGDTDSSNQTSGEPSVSVE